jgi:hypothetical protein
MRHIHVTDSSCGFFNERNDQQIFFQERAQNAVSSECSSEGASISDFILPWVDNVIALWVTETNNTALGLYLIYRTHNKWLKAFNSFVISLYCRWTRASVGRSQRYMKENKYYFNKIIVIWYVMPWILVDRRQLFGGLYWFDFMKCNKYLFSYFSTIKMEAVLSSKTLVPRDIPEENISTTAVRTSDLQSPKVCVVVELLVQCWLLLTAWCIFDMQTFRWFTLLPFYDTWL